MDASELRLRGLDRGGRDPARALPRSGRAPPAASSSASSSAAAPAFSCPSAPPSLDATCVICSGALTFVSAVFALRRPCIQFNPSCTLLFIFCTTSFSLTFWRTGAARSLTLFEASTARTETAAPAAVTLAETPSFSSSWIILAPVRRATRRAASPRDSRVTPCAKSSMTGYRVDVQWSPMTVSTAAATASTSGPCHRLKMRWPAGATTSEQGIT